MTASAEREDRAADRLATALTEAVADAIRAADGYAAGVYMRSGSPEELRLAVLAGLPGPLFRPWWRLHVDRPFPVADAYRLGMEILLADPEESTRRYPQLVAGLPFRFGSLYVPVAAGTEVFGVLTVLRPEFCGTVEALPDRDRLSAAAGRLGTALRELATAYGDRALLWDDEPLCLRPPSVGPAPARIGRFTWDPAGGRITGDDTLWELLGTPPGRFAGTPESLASAVAPDDAHQLLSALRRASAGHPPRHPLRVRAGDGTLRLVELRNPGEPPEGDAGAPSEAGGTAPGGDAPPGSGAPSGDSTTAGSGTAPGHGAAPGRGAAADGGTASGGGTAVNGSAVAGRGAPEDGGAPEGGGAVHGDVRSAASGAPSVCALAAADSPAVPGTAGARPAASGAGEPVPGAHASRARPGEPDADAAPPRTVCGLVVDPGPDPGADAVADPLPEGVFTLDRLGLVTYANACAVELLGRDRAELLGRPLWQAVPWLDRPAYEDHLRGALLSPDPAHFQVRRPPGDGAQPAPRSHEGDWLNLSIYPGKDTLTCKVVPVGHVVDSPEADPAATAPGPAGAEWATRGTAAARDTAADVASLASLYRPVVLAVALTDAMTAHQVSAVVMRELLPAFGGRRLAIYLLQERRLHLAWETGFPKGFLAPFEGVELDARLPGVETLTTGRPLFFESMDQLAAAYPGMPLDAEVGARAFLPLIASGRPVGSCILGFDTPHRFGTEERTVLTALAGLIAQALERARRYDTEAALARGLQEALLPHRLSTHPRVVTAGRYLPGTQGMDVGGDWYDVIETGDGLALVIGDVQGHGVQAAATMGQLRSAVRAFALGDRTPDKVLCGTNQLLIDLDPGQFASCLYVRLDPGTGRALAARAGHPQPLLRHPDGRTQVLDLPGGVVLGVDPGARYPVTEFRLAPDAVLALYTDGFVERPGVDIDEGVEAFRTALSQVGAVHPQPGRSSLARAADLLTEEARQAEDRPDDMALLLTTRRPAVDGGE
ncbi:hypothetical protein GCM10010358_28800 [Streptomyces minutiscleroticus]|uniref:protein-serine/threonine phosphatase n=1 Tax=Streptomyces minutiscleroticus TaxID=68238 RepID=A0A918KR21_9ACTN|nr:SpoIIE family protein phosphatase [Streptomyces minutiscleroticus]GGX72764.1 hypothetical protein GCM10010358_28800 [Streptomyces minutiscleroticus]